MKAFLKENSVLIAGITLPLILTAIFFALTQMQIKNVTPPNHSILYATNNNYNHYYKVIIKDEHAYLSIVPLPKNSHHRNYKLPDVYLFDPRSGENKQIQLPVKEQNKERQEILIDELKNIKFSAHAQSPDGFTFTSNYKRNSNLMTEMFGGGYRSRYSYVLKKGNGTIEVPNAARYNTQFIAWTL